MGTQYFLWLVAIVLFGAAGNQHVLLITRLEMHHHDFWVKLGSPRAFFDPALGNSLRMMRFYWFGEYRRLDDRSISRVATRVWLWTLAGLGVLVASQIV